MKRIIFIFKLFTFSLLGISQIHVQGNAYKSDSVYVYGNHKFAWSAPQEFLFYFGDNYMEYKKGIHQRKIMIKAPGIAQFLDSPKPNAAFTKCIDPNGLKCSIVIKYEPEADIYLLSVVYSNVTFIYECKETDERPWDDNPKGAYGLIQEQKKYPNDPDYTDAQIDSFFKSIGVNPKVARTFFMKETIKDLNFDFNF